MKNSISYSIKGAKSFRRMHRSQCVLRKTTFLHLYDPSGRAPAAAPSLTPSLHSWHSRERGVIRVRASSPRSMRRSISLRRRRAPHRRLSRSIAIPRTRELRRLLPATAVGAGRILDVAAGFEMAGAHVPTSASTGVA